MAAARALTAPEPDLGERAIRSVLVARFRRLRSAAIARALTAPEPEFKARLIRSAPGASSGGVAASEGVAESPSVLEGFAGSAAPSLGGSVEVGLLESAPLVAVAVALLGQPQPAGFVSGFAPGSAGVVELNAGGGSVAAADALAITAEPGSTHLAGGGGGAAVAGGASPGGESTPQAGRLSEPGAPGVSAQDLMGLTVVASSPESAPGSAGGSAGGSVSSWRL